MNPREILVVAERLSLSPGPANMRSAISRAYYAAYNVAMEFVRTMGAARPKRDSHTALQRQLLGSTDDVLKRIGSQLGTFCEKRNRADYVMDNPSVESKKEADAAVQWAKQTIELLDQYQPDSAQWKAARSGILNVSV